MPTMPPTLNEEDQQLAIDLLCAIVGVLLGVIIYMLL